MIQGNILKSSTPSKAMWQENFFILSNVTIIEDQRQTMLEN